jgi:hypothetical protein
MELLARRQSKNGSACWGGALSLAAATFGMLMRALHSDLSVG